MKKKKEIPLIVLQTVEPYLKKRNKLYHLADSNGSILKLNDSDNESDFYFEIKDFEVQSNKPIVGIEFKPRNSQDIDVVSVGGDVTIINTYLKKWISILEQYDKVEIEDPIIKANKERFIEQFKLIDDDADLVSFDLEQQIFLEEYLLESKKKIELLKKGKTEKEKIKLAELELEADNINSVLTKESKQKK